MHALNKLHITEMHCKLLLRQHNTACKLHLLLLLLLASVYRKGTTVNPNDTGFAMHAQQSHMLDVLATYWQTAHVQSRAELADFNKSVRSAVARSRAQTCKAHCQMQQFSPLDGRRM